MKQIKNHQVIVRYNLILGIENFKPILNKAISEEKPVLTQNNEILGMNQRKEKSLISESQSSKNSVSSNPNVDQNVNSKRKNNYQVFSFYSAISV